MPITIHFDGLCLPRNPGGVATYGFIAKRGAKKLHEEGGLAAPPYTPEATNNVAEYTGVLKALEWAVAQGFTSEPLLVRGDSELVIRQLKGEYKVKSPSIVSLYNQVRALAEKFAAIEFEWIPREKNKDADALTNRAYAEFGARASGAKRREDASAQIRRGFTIEIETPASGPVTFQALNSPSFHGGKVESAVSSQTLRVKHDDGSTTTFSVIQLADGSRIRCEHARPAGEDKLETLADAERKWHAALLALQSRLEEKS